MVCIGQTKAQSSKLTNIDNETTISEKVGSSENPSADLRINSVSYHSEFFSSVANANTITKDQINRLALFCIATANSPRLDLRTTIINYIANNVYRLNYDVIHDNEHLKTLKQLTYILYPSTANRYKMMDFFISRKLLEPTDLKLMISFIAKVKNAETAQRLDSLFELLYQGIELAKQQEKQMLIDKLNFRDITTMSGSLLLYKMGVWSKSEVQTLIRLYANDYAETMINLELGKSVADHPSVKMGIYDQVLSEISEVFFKETSFGSDIRKAYKKFNEIIKLNRNPETDKYRSEFMNLLIDGYFVLSPDSNHRTVFASIRCESVFLN
jgi:hypothetical protein